jgi:ectoine hydroxylase-related dioxygenase (phytanoyl-CoA dioxygenase family)
MLDNQIAVYGVTRRDRADDEIAVHTEELRRIGFTVIDSGLSPEAIEEVRAALDAIQEQQKQENAAAGVQMAADNDIVRCPLAYDERMLTVAANPKLVALCRAMLGENFVLTQQNGIVNRPGGEQFQTKWHRDLPFQHFTSTLPIAINALLCLDPFSKETGSTHVLPASHLFETFPSDTYVRAHSLAVDAKPGMFLVLDALLYHRAGTNVSSIIRRGVNHVIGLPLLAQQIDIPELLQGRHAQDPFLSRYLGYRWNPARSVEAWRAARS